MAQLLARVVVPQHQVGEVGEGPEDGLLQLRAVDRVVEHGALGPRPLNIVKHRDAQVCAPGGQGAAVASTVVFVRAGQVGGAAGALCGRAAVVGSDEAQIGSLQLGICKCLNYFMPTVCFDKNDHIFFLAGQWLWIHMYFFTDLDPAVLFNAELDPAAFFMWI